MWSPITLENIVDKRKKKEVAIAILFIFSHENFNRGCGCLFDYSSDISPVPDDQINSTSTSFYRIIDVKDGFFKEPLQKKLNLSFKNLK